MARNIQPLNEGTKMKFRMFIQPINESKEPWWEEYDKPTNDPVKWVEEVIDKFNNTLKRHEEPRKLLRIEKITYEKLWDIKDY